MTIVRYAPGTLRTIVAPQGVVVLATRDAGDSRGDDASTDAAAAGIWQQLADGKGLGGVIDVLAAGRPLSTLPPFAVALDEGATWRLAVRGALSVVVETSSGGVTVDGAGTSTWSERSIPDAVSLTIGEGDPTLLLPVRDGVVLASVVVIAAAERTGTPGPGSLAFADASVSTESPAPVESSVPADAGSSIAAPGEPVQPHSVDEVHDVGAGDDLDDLEATIIRGATEPPPVVGDHDGETISLAEARALRAEGKLPPVAPPLAPPPPISAIARLRLSTGQLVLLDRTVVIGRRPRSTRVSGIDLPHLIAVDSPQHDISRNHLEVRVEADTILVTDLNTTNGTTLLRPGSEPVRLHPGEQTIVIAGDVLDLGDGVTVTVEDAA